MRFSRLSPPMSFGKKVLCLALIALFAVIGIVGVILPVIPGILFLLAAAYLLTRISRRGAAYLNSQGWYRAHSRSFNAASKLTMRDNLHLFGLLAARTVVTGSEKTFNMIRQLRR